MLVAVPNILARPGIVEAETVWTTRRAVYGLKESPRLWQGEREKGSLHAHTVYSQECIQSCG
eukprot:8419191-Prorocentrum_lima.AAC.1